ncbi:1102_t:CDS:1, partial [Acaulospora colombiana]
NGLSATQVHAELGIAEGSCALSKRTIERWILVFNNGNESIEDKPRSGNLREATILQKLPKSKNW